MVKDLWPEEKIIYDSRSSGVSMTTRQQIFRVNKCSPTQDSNPRYLPFKANALTTEVFFPQSEDAGAGPAGVFQLVDV